MAFYSPSESQFTRHYREEVDMAFSAIDCLLCRDRAIYASTELTTGVRLYDALRQTATKTSAELREKKSREWFTANVWDPNVRGAIDFAEGVRRVQDDRTLVITPAPFTAPGWTQPEYLAFWETLLRTRIKSVWFNRNWQFSNGCTFEFAVAQDAQLPTRDHEGNPLDIDMALELIKEAIHILEADGFDIKSLRDNFNRLLLLRPQNHAAIEG